MGHSFDRDYWEEHWHGSSAEHEAGPNPYVVEETRGLRPGTALDAGCGTGAEALWLAAHGWQVTGADISSTALATASERSRHAGGSIAVEWVETDLSAWEPHRRWDLVVTSYAHPAMPQLAFYRRIADWVAPGGTLLIVGHLHDPEALDHEDDPPVEATVTLAAIAASLDPGAWRIETAREQIRTVPDGGPIPLRDVVVRATRRA